MKRKVVHPMQNLRASRVLLTFLAGAIATLSGSCSLLARDSASPNSSDVPSLSAEQSSSSSDQVETDAPPQAAQDSDAPASDPLTSEEAGQTAAQPDPYPDAINRASAAFNLSQSAQSQDDWLLVSNRWQQAIELMASVPSSSPNHADAQQKLTEYRRNLSYAREQAALPVPNSSSTVISIDINPDSHSSSSQSSSRSQPNRQSTSRVAGLPQTGGGVFRAPIVRRAGGTPVVMVTFNGNQTFEMIVDTGASGTVITQPMARALNVNPVGSTNVATASERNVTFLLGYVRSVEVGGARSQNLLVAIAGPELGTGLLGHDFFGNYDVTVRQNVVEFRER